MKHKAHALLLGLCLLVGQVASALADPLGDGIVAYTVVDYPNALRVLRPWADQGNPEALTTLGIMYVKGQGVGQDYARHLTILTEPYPQARRMPRPSWATCIGAGMVFPKTMARQFQGAVGSAQAVEPFAAGSGPTAPRTL
jgi:hypothetical protein